MIESTVWSPLRKICFRFFSIYLLLYFTSVHLIFAFGQESFWSEITAWFSEKILAISIDSNAYRGRSGDTLEDGMTLLLFLFISFGVTLIWSILDRKRLNYTILFEWLITLVRYFLVYSMFIYGLTKIFLVQFGDMDVSKLQVRVGDQSPMGVVWNFMAYSPGYTMLTGWIEFVGGLLLLFRRLQTLGALVVFGVMANVVALNFFYDIPVKSYSLHLFIMAFMLIVVDGKRLWYVFILNRGTEPLERPVLLRTRKMNNAKNILKWISAIAVCWYLSDFFLSIKRYQDLNRHSFCGTYDVRQFMKNSENDLEKKIYDWKTVEVIAPNYVSVKSYDDKVKDLSIKVDFSASSIEVRPLHKNKRDTLEIVSFKNEIIILKGILEKDTLNLHLRKLRKEDFRLMNYNFRWIQQQEDQQ